MESEERTRYAEALKRTAVSKAFDRILNIALVIMFITAAVYLVVQQSTYQSGVAKITEARNEQLNEIQLSQEAVNNATVDLKEYIACLKRLPVSPDEASIAICKEPLK